MSKNVATNSGGSDGSPEAQKTLVPGQTVTNAPADPGATIIGGADTVEDTKGLEAKVDPSAKTVNAAQPKTEKSSPADEASIHTFISSPDSAAKDIAAKEAAATKVRKITDEAGVHPTMDMDTATPDQTLIVEMDGGGATFIGTPDQSAGREDLEDHFDTLIEDPNQPGKSPQDPGGFVIGDYQVLKELGRGGMGVVYKARHRKLNREVALKMILAGPHAGNEALERFIIEARAVAHLQHPGIVQIFDIGEHEGLPYFSLEFVDGCDLQQKLQGKPQDAKESAVLVGKLCQAMQYAHDNNILHRDIKPPNVLLDQNGEPKITDFGLAKQVDTEEGSTATQAGTIMGSPSYMPPEQARGDVSSVTPRSDLYSLGAVLYEMLTGRPPFLAKRALETVMQVVHNEPVAPRQLMPEIPLDLETICLKALQKDQAARYGSCKELAEDLQRFVNDEPILARPIGKAERLWKWCKRNPKIALPSGLAMTAVAMTAVIATWAWQATSAQAAIITQEKENVEEQRDEAEKQKAKAVKQKLVADENAEAAKKQALVALDSIQYVVTEVDALLADKPQLTDVRITLMKALSKKWDEIDLELAGGLQGEAIATQMAVRHKIALALTALDQIDDADVEYEKLYEQGKERVQIKNQSDSSRSNLVQIATAWSPVRKRARKEPDAVVKLLSEARGIMLDIFDDPRPEEGSPTQIQLLSFQGAVSQNLGVEYLRSGNLPKSAELFGEALSANGRKLSIIRDEPGFSEKTEDQKDNATANHQMEYDRSAVALAYIQLRLGQTDESIRLYKQAIEGRREIYDRRPKVTPLKSALGGFLSNFGNSYLWLDQPENAKPVLEEAVQLNKEIYEQDTKIAGHARQLEIDYYRLATLRSVQGELDEAKDLLQKAKAIADKLVENTPDRKNKIGLMLVESRLGNREAAESLIDELGEATDKDAEVHLDRSRSLAQLSVHAESDDNRQKLVDAALTALERSVDDGYSDPFRLEHECDLDPLHGELRFKALVAKVKTSQ